MVLTFIAFIIARACAVETPSFPSLRNTLVTLKPKTPPSAPGLTSPVFFAAAFFMFYLSVTSNVIVEPELYQRNGCDRLRIPLQSPDNQSEKPPPSCGLRRSDSGSVHCPY